MDEKWWTGRETTVVKYYTISDHWERRTSRQAALMCIWPMSGLKL